MSSLFRHLNSFAGALLALALMLIVLFWVLSKASSAPVVGGAAQYVATHASGAAYGY